MVGVLSGSILAFQAVYVARLGASSLEINLLTAGPAFFNLLFSLPTAEERTNAFTLYPLVMGLARDAPYIWRLQ